VSQAQASSEPPGPGRPDAGDVPVLPVLPVQSQEDTDAGWGERPGQEDDERLCRERPPHWDDV
jgi:hypothetical protein